MPEDKEEPYTPPSDAPRQAAASALADDYSKESEPYLGPAWALAMLLLYLLKQAFPAEQFTFLWWVQMYVIAIVLAVTIFTLVKRRQFYRAERAQKTSPLSR